MGHLRKYTMSLWAPHPNSGTRSARENPSTSMLWSKNIAYCPIEDDHQSIHRVYYILYIIYYIYIIYVYIYMDLETNHYVWIDMEWINKKPSYSSYMMNPHDSPHGPRRRCTKTGDQWTMATGTRAFWEEMDGIWWDSGMVENLSVGKCWNICRINMNKTIFSNVEYVKLL